MEVSYRQSSHPLDLESSSLHTSINTALPPVSGISKWMVDRSAELGHQRSNFASLMYQIIDDRVFAGHRANHLYIESYAMLFYEVVR